MSSDERPILLPASVERLVGAATKIFTRPEAPPVALVGGLAVIARLLSVTEQAYRATTDVDLVAETTDPSVLVVLGGPDDDRSHHVSIDGTDVDVIATEAISHEDLLEFEDHGQRLFLGGHRWAYETAEPARLITGSSEATVLLATPASLVLTKSHALGFASQRRRASKRGPDMLDLFRLIETFNRGGALAEHLRLAPGQLAAVVAEVVTREILAQPASAARLMSTLTPGPVTADDVGDVLDVFVADLLP